MVVFMMVIQKGLLIFPRCHFRWRFVNDCDIMLIIIPFSVLLEIYFVSLHPLLLVYIIYEPREEDNQGEV